MTESGPISMTMAFVGTCFKAVLKWTSEHKLLTKYSGEAYLAIDDDHLCSGIEVEIHLDDRCLGLEMTFSKASFICGANEVMKCEW